VTASHLPPAITVVEVTKQSRHGVDGLMDASRDDLTFAALSMAFAKAYGLPSLERPRAIK